MTGEKERKVIMSYFTYAQDSALKTIIEAVIQSNNNPELVKLINENDLLEAIDKDSYIEAKKDDVSVVAENEGYELTDNQLLQVVHRVMSEYSYKSYNNSIEKFIREEICPKLNEPNKV